MGHALLPHPRRDDHGRHHTFRGEPFFGFDLTLLVQVGCTAFSVAHAHTNRMTGWETGPDGVHLRTYHTNNASQTRRWLKKDALRFNSLELVRAASRIYFLEESLIFRKIFDEEADNESARLDARRWQLPEGFGTPQPRNHIFGVQILLQLRQERARQLLGFRRVYDAVH